MTDEKTPTQKELAEQVADLKARLRASHEALAEMERIQTEGKAACRDELQRVREVQDIMGLANLIVENSPAVLFRREATEEAALVYLSDNISQWGYTAEELLSGRLRFKDIVLDEDNDRLVDEIATYKERGVDKYTQEYRIRTADGDIRWISDETSICRDERGTVMFNQGVLMDITRRKEVEEALSASEFKFRRTIEGAGEGYLLLSHDLIIEEVNDAYCRMLGYSREEMLGKRPRDFATLEYQRFLETNHERLLEQDYRCFEGQMLHKDGHVVPVLINSNTLRDAEGGFLGNVAFVADLTEQKKAVELAGEVQKSLMPDRAPTLPGLDVAGHSEASQVAGGDYFDYLEGLDPDHPTLSVVVGDISGHGVDAALLMTTARGFLRMRATQPGSPSQIVTEMNRQLATDLDGSGRFMTLFYLTLDPARQTVGCVRAGHDPALIYCPKFDSFTELGGESSGLPVGVDKNSRYPECTSELYPNHIIAVGTDGIWEARNSEGEMFGKVRFREVIRANAAAPAQDILDAVFKAVRVFADGVLAEDDITLVIIKSSLEG